MFIQVIEGRTRDPEAVHRRLEVWERELMPGAIGYLGSTGGCTDAGDCILIARFESRDAAQRNSERPEQTQWWQETERCFDGPVRFHDSEEVVEMTHGPRHQARFVQVMEGRVTDKARAMELERRAEPLLAEARPDLLGGFTAYHDDGAFTEIAYFTSQEDARAGEDGDVPEEFLDEFQEWQQVLKVERYLDLATPWLSSPRT